MKFTIYDDDAVAPYVSLASDFTWSSLPHHSLFLNILKLDTKIERLIFEMWWL